MEEETKEEMEAKIRAELEAEIEKVLKFQELGKFVKANETLEAIKEKVREACGLYRDFAREHLHKFPDFGRDRMVHNPLTDTKLKEAKILIKVLLYVPSSGLTSDISISHGNKTAFYSKQRLGHDSMYVDAVAVAAEENKRVNQNNILRHAIKDALFRKNFIARVMVHVELVKLVHNTETVVIYCGGRVAQAALSLSDLIGDALVENLHLYKGKDALEGCIIIMAPHPCAGWMAGGCPVLMKQIRLVYSTINALYNLIEAGTEIKEETVREYLDEEDKRLLAQKEENKNDLITHFRDEEAIMLVKKKYNSFFYYKAQQYIELDKALKKNNILNSKLRFTICFGIRLSQDGAAANFEGLIEKLQANFQDYEEILIAQAAAKLMTSTSFSAALKNGEALEYIDEAKEACVANFSDEPVTLGKFVEFVKTNSAAAGRKIKEKKRSRKKRTYRG